MKINSRIYRCQNLGPVLQLLLVNLVLVSCPIFGQVKPTKILTAADYHLWSTIDRLKISDDGNWVSYRLEYESGADTLFLRNTKTSKTFSFANASNESFNGTYFSFIDEQQHFISHSLDGRSGFSVAGTDRYIYLNNRKLIAVLRKDVDKRRMLEIRDCAGKLLKTVLNIEHFNISPLENKIAYITSQKGLSEIGILELGTFITYSKIFSSSEAMIVNPVWQGNDTSLAFVLKGDTPSLYSYQLKTKSLYSIRPEVRKEFPQHFRFAGVQSEFLSVSDDGKRLSFLIEENGDITNAKQNGSEVWNTDDCYLQPAQPYHSETRLGVWMPENDSFVVVGGKLEEIVLIAGNGRYVVTADISPYMPSVKFDSDSDYYITDCNTGVKILLLKKYFGESEKMMESPDGKYLSYFRDGDWWLYDLATQQNINLTHSSKTTFAAEDVYGYSVLPPFGDISWSADGKSIFAYSKFDIWRISIDGQIHERITKGAEKGLIMRFSDKNYKVAYDAFFVRKSKEIGLEKPVLLEAVSEDYNVTGFYSLTDKSAEKKIVVKDKSLKQIVQARNSDIYAYIEQDSDLPPAIMLQRGDKQNLLFQSNSHFMNYGKSKSALIEYKGYEGGKLKGVLFYPFNYNPEIKYPMVVYVYQKLSMYQHQYQNPTLFDAEGFNITNFTSRGYFVLYPDINHEIGKPGISATKCVIAATKAAIEHGSIDEKNIGLIGHSFGGYETNFIVTQTNTFKCAVSGSAVADLQQSYFSLSKSYKRPTFWYYEFYQGRMGKAIFEDWDNYRENSPIYHAEKIKTPLLLWTGAEDNQVPSSQTMSFYMALRRLQKTCTMLIYPKEGHAFKTNANQEDLSVKIMNWFDHYLKGLPLQIVQ